jgi:hypothetical protein
MDVIVRHLPKFLCVVLYMPSLSCALTYTPLHFNMFKSICVV